MNAAILQRHPQGLDLGDHFIDIIARETGFGEGTDAPCILRAFGQPPHMMRWALQLQA